MAPLGRTRRAGLLLGVLLALQAGCDTAANSDIDAFSLPGNASEASAFGRRLGEGGASCPWNFKVYVYEFPDHLPFRKWAKELQAQGTQWYGNEAEEDMFSLELLLHRMFLTSCVRTRDPEAADFFFVPFYSDIDFRMNGRKASPSAYGKALVKAFEGDVAEWEQLFGVTGEYWKRKQGWDHIVTMAAPLTSFTHEKSRRGIFHNKKMLIPPIVFNVELLNRFVKEYPACGGQKNMLVPYPGNGVQWADGTHLRNAVVDIQASLHSPQFSPAVRWMTGHLQAGTDPWEHLQQNWSGFSTDEEVSKILVAARKDLFAMSMYGMMHDCKPLRRTIREHLQRDDCLLCLANGGKRDLVGSGAKIASGAIHDKQGRRVKKNTHRQELTHRPLFCPSPAGDSPGAKRMYDVVRAGCIPVILSDDFIYPWSKEAGLGDLEEASYSLRIPTDALDGYESPQHDRMKEDSPSSREAFSFAVAESWDELPWFKETESKVSAAGGGLGSYLRSVPPMKIKALLEGVERVKERYFDYWKLDEGDATYKKAYLSDGKIVSLLAVEEAEPRGGAVGAIMDSLQAKLGAPYRAACEEEMRAPHRDSGRGYC